MTINPTLVLQDLDKHAKEFDFPVLDNAYVEFAGARLTSFLNSVDWLIFFEVVGFSERQVEFVDNIYAYGSCIDRQGFVAEEIPLESTPLQPLFDPVTNESLADWRGWSIKLNGQVIKFAPTLNDYDQAGITIDRAPGPGSLREIELMRFLLARLGEDRLFMSDEAILAHFPRCKNISKFIQTTEWQHPDIADGEKPSENVSVCSLVEALTKADDSIFDKGTPNTHWTFWADRKSSSR